MNDNKEMNIQEMISLLKKNDIIPDSKCSREDLEALINLEIKEGV